MPGKCSDGLHSSQNNIYSSPQVVRDVGRIQNIVGRILSDTGQAYFVDAVRKGQAEFLFEYGGLEVEEEQVQHFSRENSGDCLTYSSDGGALTTRGEDCGLKRLPLCFRIDTVNDSAISAACTECNSGGGTEVILTRKYLQGVPKRAT